MLYAILKTLHLLSIILWIGGMAFVLFFLRPALGSLQPPARVTLMHDVLRRFFGAVSAAIIIVLVSGLWMMGEFASGGSGQRRAHADELDGDGHAGPADDGHLRPYPLRALQAAAARRGQQRLAGRWRGAGRRSGSGCWPTCSSAW